MDSYAQPPFSQERNNPPAGFLWERGVINRPLGHADIPLLRGMGPVAKGCQFDAFTQSLLRLIHFQRYFVYLANDQILTYRTCYS